MRARLSRTGILAVLAVWALVHVPAGAQVAAPAGDQWKPPRTPDGQPDIQGFWSNVYTPSVAINIEEAFWRPPREDKGTARFKSPIIDPADGKIPYQPWAIKKRLELQAAGEQIFEAIDPQAHCFPSGVPRLMYRYREHPLQILQTPGYVVLLHEFNHTNRVIRLDAREALPERFTLWMGDARGRWENSTLIVETTNLNGKSWFDESSSFQGGAMRTVERFTFTDPNSIRYEVTVTDPTVFERPWTMAFPLERRAEPDLEILEQACHEGERSTKELVQRLLKAKGRRSK